MRDASSGRGVPYVKARAGTDAKKQNDRAKRSGDQAVHIISHTLRASSKPFGHTRLLL